MRAGEPSRGPGALRGAAVAQEAPRPTQRARDARSDSWPNERSGRHARHHDALAPETRSTVRAATALRPRFAGPAAEASRRTSRDRRSGPRTRTSARQRACPRQRASRQHSPGREPPGAAHRDRCASRQSQAIEQRRHRTGQDARTTPARTLETTRGRVDVGWHCRERIYALFFVK